ncbi:MAG: alpha-amylase family glycosyl hydrolase [Pseudomonadota bacterium]
MSNKAHDEWWRGAIIYQIYPRSFADTTGSGVGDLNGVTSKLDYVASLGVDGIWLSPFFRSPMKDYGYDVADYVDVDPIFGTLDDFDQLVQRAHSLDLKVVIDQVYSHTSDQHAWFKESRTSRDNPTSNWYVWADAKEDGTPPNNWLSVFGGSAWTWDARRQQYYLHNFLAEQPDLNLYDPAVQSALHNVARFWLERGVDGFRLDAINFGMHDRQLRDNPPSVSPFRDLSTPFRMQDQAFNLSQPGMPLMLEHYRQVLDTYGEVFSVAEIGGATPMPTMHAYTRGHRRLSTAYGFEFLSLPELTADAVGSILRSWPNGCDNGWPAWAFSNHDVPRAVSRWLPGVEHERRAELILLLLVSLRGNLFVYQGEELGLPQADVPFERLLDPEAIANWPHTAGRDGARTPMPWERSIENGGFSTAAPWLPVDPLHLSRAVAQQESADDSTLQCFRRLLAVRQKTSALRLGDLDILTAEDGLLSFTRNYEGDIAHCAFNLGDEARPVVQRSAHNLTVVAGAGNVVLNSDRPAELEPYSGFIAVHDSR